MFLGDLPPVSSIQSLIKIANDPNGERKKNLREGKGTRKLRKKCNVGLSLVGEVSQVGCIGHKDHVITVQRATYGHQLRRTYQANENMSDHVRDLPKILQWSYYL